jgi:Tfp pilus assembly protein PilX
LAALQNTNLEERMAGNMRAENIALQAAEAALRTGEAWLDLVPSVPSPSEPGSKDEAVQVWAESDIGDENKDGKFGPYAVLKVDPWWANWPSDGDTDATNYWLKYAEAVPAEVVLQFAQITKKNSEGETSKESLALADSRLPRFLIEEDGFQPDHLVVGQQQDTGSHPRRYRVTARGVDAGGRGEVLLQTQFVRRF